MFVPDRTFSNLGVSWSWPEMPPGFGPFESHVPVVFSELHQPRLLEVIPSATVSRNQTRGDDQGWQEATSIGDLGVSVKYGLTSTVPVVTGAIGKDAPDKISRARRFPSFSRSGSYRN